MCIYLYTIELKTMGARLLQMCVEKNFHFICNLWLYMIVFTESQVGVQLYSSVQVSRNILIEHKFEYINLLSLKLSN